MNHPLDNPIWHSLISRHQSFALGDDYARRYPLSISPLSAIKSGRLGPDNTLAVYESLEKIVDEGNSIFFFLDEAPGDLPKQASKSWQVKYTLPILQMVCEAFQPVPPTASDRAEIIRLNESHVEEMLALTKLTEPGPFHEETIQMGHYYGIFEEGRLAAMAGERLHLEDYTEVSAVCTHPEFQGRGYAKRLVAHVSEHILETGKTPILHVKADNEGAIHVYRSLGFIPRRLIHFAILARVPATVSNCS